MSKFIERCQAFEDGKTLQRFSAFLHQWFDQIIPDIKDMRDHPDRYRVKPETLEAYLYRTSLGALSVTSLPHGRRSDGYIKTITIELEQDNEH